MLSIQVTDSGVQAALNALSAKISNLSPVLREIGEDISERTKQRFTSSTGPDGQRWRPNARSTIEAYIASKGGFGKRGINQKGQGLAMNKRPLIATRGLSRSIRYQIINGGNGVEIGTNWFAGKISSGAAIHQFGGKAGKGKKTTIPARPFLPIKQNGELYSGDREKILETINSYLYGK